MSVTTSVQYQTSGGTARTEFGSDANLNSLANGAACALGAVNNVANGALDYFVDLTLVVASTPTAGNTIVVYLIQAPNTGTQASPVAGTYTDGISPTGASVAASLNSAVAVATVAMTAATTYNVSFRLPVVVPPPFWSLVVKNGSGVAMASSGNAAFWSPDTAVSQ